MEFDNDIGKPWRWVEEDGTVVTRGAAWSAPGCHPTGCGIKTYVKDGQLVRIEGDENHPVTKGACAFAASPSRTSPIIPTASSTR